jgi:hypothetical protein
MLFDNVVSGEKIVIDGFDGGTNFLKRLGQLFVRR